MKTPNHLDQIVIGFVFAVIVWGAAFVAHRCIIEMHIFEDNGTVARVMLR